MNAEDYWWQGNQLDDYDDNNNDDDRGEIDPPTSQKATNQSRIDNQSTQQNTDASTAMMEFVDLQAHDSHSDRSVVDDDDEDDDDDYDDGDD